MTRTYISNWLLLLLLLCAPGGCGYRLTADPALSSPIAGKKVAVPVFANKSYRANLGAFLTWSLVEEFARRSGGRVTKEDDADLVLSGTVVSYAGTPLSYTAYDRVAEYKATVTVEATLVEKATRAVVWKGTVSWSQSYPVRTRAVKHQHALIGHKILFPNISTAVRTNVALQQDSEEAALREICDKVAQQIYERISQGF